MVKYLSTKLEGVWVVNSTKFYDSRGSFLNLFRSQDHVFKETWGDETIAQINLSQTKEVGCIRGLHLQADPYSEAKLVRCIKGRVWDVAVDLRIDSKSYGKWHAEELSSVQGNALLVPKGCAHGFQVLEPNSEVLYLHSGAWVPEAEIGIRWNDPQVGVNWPLPLSNMSDRDRSLPLLLKK